MVGRRFFRPKFRTKSRNFPVLESLMKQKICPRNVVGQKYVLNALMKLAPAHTGFRVNSVLARDSFI